MSEIGKMNSTPGTTAVIYDITRARRRAAAQSHAQPADSAGFSEGARELARANEAVEAAPDVRAERVQALKQQIESGQYNPDAREVAKRILERGL